MLLIASTKNMKTVLSMKRWKKQNFYKYISNIQLYNEKSINQYS